MTRLTALLPVAQGVAAYAALCKHADTEIADGDGRSRGQVMADTLVERITGQASAQDVPVEVHLVMPADTLLGSGTEPAHLDGHGPIPAEVARHLALHPDRDAPVWLRRLFTAPGTGELISMETKRRLFTKNQRTFIRLRDQTFPRRLRPRWRGDPHCTPGARHPLGTPTTSAPPTQAARPTCATAPDCASPATSPKKHPAGEPDPDHADDTT